MADSIETLGSDLEVFPFYPNYAGGVNFLVNKNYSMLQYGEYSPVDITNDIDDKQMSISAKYLLQNMEDKYNFLTFMDDHSGMRKAFWLYTNIDEFKLKELIPANSFSLVCENCGYENAYKTVDRIYIYLANGDIIVRQVQSASYSTVTEEMTVALTTATPGYIIQMSDVLEIGRVMCCRFDIDVFDTQNVSSNVTEVNVRFLELPKEYPA